LTIERKKKFFKGVFFCQACLPTGRPVCPCPTAGGPARRQAGTGREEYSEIIL